MHCRTMFYVVVNHALSNGYTFCGWNRSQTIIHFKFLWSITHGLTDAIGWHYNNTQRHIIKFKAAIISVPVHIRSCGCSEPNT